MGGTIIKQCVIGEHNPHSATIDFRLQNSYVKIALKVKIQDHLSPKSNHF